jgi:hypothetical protein
MLLKQLHDQHIYSSTRSPDHPDDEFADHETDRKNLKEPETIPALIPSKTLEIVANGTPGKKLSENPKPPPLGDMFRQHPESPPLGDTSRQPPNSPPLGDMSRRHPKSPPLGEMSRSDRGGLPPDAEDRGGFIAAMPDKPLPPGKEAEPIRLTDELQAAKARGDVLAQFNAIEKIIDLYNP